MGLFIGDNAPSKIFVGDNQVSSVRVGDTQVRPSSQPITEIGIYWSEADGVISFQTSAGNGISIADKNLGATQVYNNGDTYSFANIGYGYERGNNYGWDFNVNPVNTSNTPVDTTGYGPGNYYSSDVFILIPSGNEPYWWSSVDNDNLWGATTNTYEARRGPCATGWHIPSKADATALVNAISSITGSVTGTKIKQYCKLTNRLPAIGRFDGMWDTVGVWGGIVYSDSYNSLSSGLLYLPDDGTYIINENCRKSNAFPQRPFSNTFIQPTTNWTRLDS